jgi:hypothetical protein
MDQWVSATWHMWGPLVRYPTPRWGPPVLTWTNEIVTRGSCLLTWPTLVLPRGTPSLLFCFVFSVLLIPSLHPRLLLSPSCTQRGLWSNLSPWSAYLICFIFSEFILIAPLVQKFWNFHQKSLNLWWSLCNFKFHFCPHLLASKNSFAKKTLFSFLN